MPPQIGREMIDDARFRYFARRRQVNGVRPGHARGATGSHCWRTKEGPAEGLYVCVEAVGARVISGQTRAIWNRVCALMEGVTTYADPVTATRNADALPAILVFLLQRDASSSNVGARQKRTAPAESPLASH
jgi:hypothetical protein